MHQKTRAPVKNVVLAKDAALAKDVVQAKNATSTEDIVLANAASAENTVSIKYIVPTEDTAPARGIALARDVAPTEQATSPVLVAALSHRPPPSSAPSATTPATKSTSAKLNSAKLTSFKEKKASAQKGILMPSHQPHAQKGVTGIQECLEKNTQLVSMIVNGHQEQWQLAIKREEHEALHFKIEKRCKQYKEMQRLL